MAYFHWVEGEMEGHVVATDEADARRQLGEPDAPALRVARVVGPVDSVDFQEADAVLGDHHGALLAQRKLGVHLTETPHARSSHFGGLPRLAPQQAWPGGARPLPLLLELDLEELAADTGGAELGLPRDGYLSIFFDLTSSSREFAVMHSAKDGAETRRAPEGCLALAPRGIVGGLELTSPHPEEPAVVELFDADAELLDSYSEFYAEYAESGHMLLGHPHWLDERGDVPSDMLQLIQIRGEVGWFGVESRECCLNLLIHPEDLASRDFSSCVVVVQVS